MPIPFIAAEISGVTLQEYDNSAVPRSYVDAISGALDTRLDALAGATAVSFGAFTAGDEISGFTAGTFAVSSASGTPLTIGVKGYATISSQAKYAHDEILASGTKYHNAYAWFNASASKISTELSEIAASGDEYSTAYDWYTQSSSKLSDAYAWYNASASKLSSELSGFIASGEEYTSAYDWYAASASKISEFVASGDEYSRAYASAQALENGAFIRVASGWASIADTETIAHTLGAKPTHVSLTPSGLVTFATAFTVDATNITVRLSCAGSRMLNWRAEL